MSEGADALRGRLEPHRPEPARLELALRGEEGESAALRTVIERLRERFSYVIVDFEALPRVPTEVCDLLIRVEADAVSADAERTAQALPVINLGNGQSSPVPLNHCEPYVIPFDPNVEGLSASEQGRYLIDNPRSVAAPTLYRLARKILGRTVGLALGGGAAYGVSHVGVLRVLESEGIPVDLIAGTSMGSVIALAYASGASPAMLAEGVRPIGSLRALPALLDFTFTRPGLLAGNRVADLLAPLMGGCETFNDLRLPCRAVAADIETGERVQLTEGRLVDAFRASCAVPMVWSPVERDGRLLVDGGMNDPVPAGVVHEMGADVCIAVNVVPPPRKGVTNQLGRLARSVRKLNPISRLAGTVNLPNSFEVIVNTIQGLQHELGNFKAIAADVRIHPELSEFAWTDFHRSDELAERGAEAAERALPQIRRAIAERGPAPWGDDRM
jgi:NTE family protein